MQQDRPGRSIPRAMRMIIVIAALCLAVLAIARLEAFREPVTIEPLAVGTTPATLYTGQGKARPLVIVAHGFAGSRQLMESISLTLARAGYDALAFDFEGHGRNPVPMSGDVTAIDGTTRKLIAETERVVTAGREATGWQGQVALIGHSMASDVVIRTALEDSRIGPVIAISMFSEAVTATRPDDLLMISGGWETRLRQVALDRLHMVAAGGAEGSTMLSGDLRRRAAVAPSVEHVGVLFSQTTLNEIRTWLDDFYNLESSPAADAFTGPWIALLLLSLPALGWGLAATLPDRHSYAVRLPSRTFLAASLVPAALVPLVATRIDTGFLPVLTADYLAIHLLGLGLFQLLLAWWFSGARPTGFSFLHLAALITFGIGIFGFAIDRYLANFMLTPSRLPIFLAISAGTIAFMLADAVLTEGGRAPLWRRIFARIAFFGSLALAIALDWERLMFLAIIFPVLLLFFVIYGLMGRWVAGRSGPATSGIGLGLILAWSLAVTFPLFSG